MGIYNIYMHSTLYYLHIRKKLTLKAPQALFQDDGINHYA